MNFLVLAPVHLSTFHERPLSANRRASLFLKRGETVSPQHERRNDRRGIKHQATKHHAIAIAVAFILAAVSSRSQS
jgi:hypothetical protein